MCREKRGEFYLNRHGGLQRLGAAQGPCGMRRSSGGQRRQERKAELIPSMHISNHPTSIHILFDISPEIANSNATRGQVGVINKQSWPGIRR